MDGILEGGEELAFLSFGCSYSLPSKPAMFSWQEKTWTFSPIPGALTRAATKLSLVCPVSEVEHGSCPFTKLVSVSLP
jgi:hypothetical protein